MATDTAICPNCGQSNPGGMRFCGHCGAALTPPAPVPEPAPAAGPPEHDPDKEPTRELETTVLATTVPSAPARATRPPIPAAPPLNLEIPQEPIARERERDRLLSLASVQRMRAQVLNARATLQQALLVAEGMPGPQVAPIHEMLGDMLAAEERWEQAADCYEQAQLLDPSRASAERKFGEMTLRIADEKAMAALGGSAALSNEAITSGSKAKRNPGFAMILSLIVPGFGQFYNGQFIKGCVCLGVFVVAMFLISLTPDVRAIRCIFAQTAGCRGLSISPLTWFCLLVIAGDWLYSLVDAPYSASKTESTLGEAGPVIDKSGWEV